MPRGGLDHATGNPWGGALSLLRMLRGLAIALVVVWVGSADAAPKRKVKIVTEPPGAKVVKEEGNTALGVTPYKYETSMWIWEAEKVKVTSATGESKSIELKRSEFDMLPGPSRARLSAQRCRTT